MLLQGGFEFLSLLWGCHGVAWLGGLDHKTTGGMRTVIPLQQKQRENCVCGRYRVLRVQCCFSLFFFSFSFVLICDTHRNGKKKCVARAAHGGGSGRYRIGRMEKNANGVTTQPKFTHGQIWRGNTTAVAGVVVWPGVGAG
jgi:hypothetical protein